MNGHLAARYSPPDVFYGEKLCKDNEWGMSLSGGGSRACMAYLGIFRALYNENMLDDKHFCIISTNSGGSWPLIPLLYENSSGLSPTVETLLHPTEFINPASVTLDNLECKISEQSCASLAVNDYLSSAMLSNMMSPPFGDTHLASSAAFGQATLKKMRLYDINSPSVINYESRENSLVVIQRKNMPMPVIAFAVYNRDTNGRTYENFYLDSSPQTTGYLLQKPHVTKTGTHVGGRVDTFAMNTSQVIELSTPQMWNNRKYFQYIYGEHSSYGPSEIMSSTAGVPGNLMSDHPKAMASLDKYMPYYRFPTSPANQRILTADAGIIDNNSMLSQLARKIKNIVWIMPVPSDLRDGIIDTNVRQLFGVNFKGNIVKYRRDVRVFSMSFFDKLNSGIYKGTKDFTIPSVVTFRDVQVLKNVYHGIEAYKISRLIVWYFTPSSKFRDLLPSKIRDIIYKDNTKFPIFNVINPDKTHSTNLFQMRTEQANSLAIFTQWAAREYLIPTLKKHMKR